MAKLALLCLTASVSVLKLVDYKSTSDPLFDQHDLLIFWPRYFAFVPPTPYWTIFCIYFADLVDGYFELFNGPPVSGAPHMFQARKHVVPSP